MIYANNDRTALAARDRDLQREEWDKPKMYCNYCNEPIYDGEYYYRFDRDCLCEVCVKNAREVCW